MSISHEEAVQAAKRLLGERFDPSLSLAALGDMCGHAFSQVSCLMMPAMRILI